MSDHEDIRAAAEYVTLIHRRDAKAEYERWGLSQTAVVELLDKNFMRPASLIDQTLEEAYMQRELSSETFHEIWIHRRK